MNIGVDFLVRGPNWEDYVDRFDDYTDYIKLSSVSYSLDDQANVTFAGEQIQWYAFPTTLALATIIVVAVVGAGLLVYFKKHKR